MHPGLTDTDCRVAEMRLREMRAEAQRRRLDGHDAVAHRPGGEPGALRRLGGAGAGLIALLLGRRADNRARRTTTALREGAAP